MMTVIMIGPDTLTLLYGHSDMVAFFQGLRLEATECPIVVDKHRALGMSEAMMGLASQIEEMERAIEMFNNLVDYPVEHRNKLSLDYYADEGLNFFIANNAHSEPTTKPIELQYRKARHRGHSLSNGQGACW
jgi:hypothetical protein